MGTEKFQNTFGISPERAEQMAQYPVEDVVVHVRDMKELCMVNPDAPGCSHEACNGVEEEIHHSEVGPVYDLYATHKVITFKDIERDTQRVVTAVTAQFERDSYDEEERKPIEVNLKLLSSRAAEIRTAAHRYVQTLAQFNAVKRQQLRLEPEDFKDKMLQIDKRRKITHDMLIQALKEYRRIIYSLEDQGMLSEYQIYDWEMGMDVPEVAEGSKILPTFSVRFLEKRDLIKDWAVSANLSEDITSIRAAVEMKTMPGK